MAAGGASIERVVWFVLKGETKPDMVRIAADRYIADLQDSIKSKCSHTLGGLDARQLDIYMKNGDTEALKPGMLVSTIDGGKDDDHPLFVDCPDVTEPAGKRLRTEEVVKELEEVNEALLRVKRQLDQQNATSMLALRMAQVRPIPMGAERTVKRSWWGSEVRRYYQLGDAELSCAVLTSLYPTTVSRFAKWARNLGWGSPFPAVAEHIIPDSQPTAQAAADIDPWSGANSIPLLKNIECHYQAGHLAIFPTQNEQEFEIYVSCDCRRTTVVYERRHRREHLLEDTRVRVLHTNGREEVDLLLGDLHRATFKMPVGPSMRALYFKARMAHQESCRNGGGGIPDPDENAYYMRFLSRCTHLGDLLTRSLVHVPPD